ncbi:MAG: thioredoxin family protein [Patescibacteria group bacterium]
MTKGVAIILGVIVVVVAGGIYLSTGGKNEAMKKDDAMTQKDVESDAKLAMENEAMAGKEELQNKEAMMKVGSYEVYAPEKVLMASATHHVVLFFRASWCPTCRAVDTDIKTNLTKIPSDLAILDVNYDDSTVLKKKYGVTYQHTFVQVDKDGNLIKKWSGSPTLSALVAEVK